MLKTQIAAMKRFQDAQNKAGVDAIITIHASLDKELEKLRASGNRSHPFVSKDDSDRFGTILLECAQAKLAWAASE